MEGLEDLFLKFMCRQLVGLGYEFEYQDNGVRKTSTNIISGFVISMHGRWYWATAGHCLKRLDKQIQSGELKIIGGGFADCFGWDAEFRETIPYSYEPKSALVLYGGTASLDFALLPLDQLIAKAFRKNGVIAVERAGWVKQHELEFSQYKVLGFPFHLQELDRALPAVRPVMLAIERIEDEEKSNDHGERFVGRIHPDAKIEKIEGMSGGPIFGFRKDGNNWAYHVVAIQSGWFDTKRIITGCLLPPVAEEVYQWMQRFYLESESGPPGPPEYNRKSTA